jgi:hypothetical protein
MKLGFATGNTENLKLADWCTRLKNIPTNYIEVGFGNTNRIPEVIDDEIVESLSSFDWISIHGTVHDGDKILRYPSKEADYAIGKMLELVSKCKIKAVLFHPDLVDDFEYLNKLFGDKLAFENMDNRKDFGNTIEDMQKVFDLSPQAKWVCDVNHIFTLDPTMSIAKKFHEEFRDRLSHYHISSYGEKIHCLFQDSMKNEILNGVMNLDVPMINEGFGDPEDISRLDKELNLVKSIIEKR